MADFSINLGDVFLLDTGASKYHWYIAIAPLSSEEFIFVNVSTWYEDSPTNDQTCILSPSKRMPRFIRRKSFIAYQYARSFTASQLEKLIVPDSGIPYATLERLALRRIQQESLNATKLKKKYLKALQQYLGLPEV
ncbi:hypothetical protein PN441_14610 [Spirulina major CS-329]|uniref:hypothetical protein n=1 Tax=Spirulina TaxID=1154 RepID=UPI00232D24DB|nr:MULTISPECIES: hypothetical protein [Spirulina]MDB9495540.1 hypothetical protein [Spirulina subsalsa CS-330]MDB9504307.1 hypothetical protein [Spirulina major CS-329]